MATRCLILYNYLRWGGYKIVVELPDDIYHLYSFWGTIKIIIVREGFIGNNLFSLGGLIDWNPSASPRDLIIKPPLLHRLFPNKSLPDYDYFYIMKKKFDQIRNQGHLLYLQYRDDHWSEAMRCLLGNNLWSRGGLMIKSQGEAEGI